ncbi:hypothetical protein FDUTEX481_00383 [Tolypothrix sp. PCC 7601]|nr:hypothetical protein FDUTEX481_00383 [Tolypothrix sp. PCC 7601]
MGNNNFPFFLFPFPLSPFPPHPQSPVPNPQSPIHTLTTKENKKYFYGHKSYMKHLQFWIV